MMVFLCATSTHPLSGPRYQLLRRVCHLYAAPDLIYLRGDANISHAEGGRMIRYTAQYRTILRPPCCVLSCHELIISGITIDTASPLGRHGLHATRRIRATCCDFLSRSSAGSIRKQKMCNAQHFRGLDLLLLATNLTSDITQRSMQTGCETFTSSEDRHRWNPDAVLFKCRRGSGGSSDANNALSEFHEGISRGTCSKHITYSRYCKRGGVIAWLLGGVGEKARGGPDALICTGGFSRGTDSDRSQTASRVYWRELVMGGPANGQLLRTFANVIARAHGPLGGVLFRIP
ncbi:hypothetical protein F4861DRAFT_302676 [Xylaria intraflava]|nr:hypothetical protein F4861DRAFT_302676 [Xylaria intraflava]